jgi:long-chain acyl-CoA synthetase
MQRRPEKAMEKIWLASYPSGVPHEIDPRAFESVPAMFAAAVARYGNRPAFSSMGVAISFAELDRLSREFAAFLQGRGLVKGDRIAVMMPNVLQYPVALHGALRAGLTVVNCNPLYTARELEHQLKDSGAKAIVVIENFARTLQEVVARTGVRTVVTTELGDLFPPVKRLLVNLVVRHVKKLVPPWRIDGAVPLAAALAEGRRGSFAPPALGPDDLAFLQYTGGTTGVPKGAMLTHGNIVANVLQAAGWINVVLAEQGEIAVMPLPLYHVFALTTTLTLSLTVGADIVLIANPRDLPGFVAELRKRPFSVIVGVNTLYRALVEAQGFGDVDGRSVKLAIAGGMAMQKHVSDKWKAATGRPVVEGYGLTETSPFVSANPLDATEFSGTIGLPFPSTGISIRGEDGVELAIGETGELCVQGPQVMKGYWQRPEETAEVFHADGWLRTGDMGFVDPRGYVKLTDRKKDMIIVSGFKVYPNEVEEVVMSHAGVQEAVAIPAADERSGQAVKVVVVRRDPGLTTESVIAYCRERLTGYKVPKYVQFRSEPLPKTPVGKILRRVVRDEVEKESARPGASS